VTGKNTIKKMNVEIANMIGQVIYSTQPQASNGSLNIPVDVSGFTSGSYIVEVTIDGKEFFKQLVVHH
jgi:hypothetical protein